MPAIRGSSLLCRSLLLTALFTGLFCSLAAGAVVLGDVNRDGFANALDVQIAISIILGNESPFAHAADLDKNGQVNAIDLQLVINAVLGYSIPAYVPDVVGMTQSAAQVEITYSGLSVGSITEQYDADIPVGQVIAQAPSPGNQLPQGASINIVLSSGLVHAEFFALPGSGAAPLQVQFKHSDPLVVPHVTSWAWDFDGDGIVDSTDPSPTHVYEDAGVYAVTLSIQTSDGSTANSFDAEAVVVREAIDVIVRANIVVVDNEPDLDFASKTENALTLELLNGAPNPISPDDIVVGSHEGGYARRIVAITVNGAALTLDTENAPLTDIFEQADISGLLEFTPEDMAKAGFQITKDGRAKKSFTDYEIDAGITVSGSLEFEPVLDWDLRPKWGSVEYFRCVFVGTLSANFETSVGIEGGLYRKTEKSILPPGVKISKTGWYPIGGVPVLIRTEFDIKAGMEAGVEGDLSLRTGYNIATSVRFGAEYNSSYTDPWRPIIGTSFNPRRYGPEFSFEGGGYLKVYIKPEAKLRIYGLAGPSASIEPYVKGEIPIVANPELVLKAGIESEIGFSLVELSCIGLNFDLGLSGRFEGPVVVLGRFPLKPPSVPAKPAFHASPTSGTAPLTVTFTDQSSPGTGTILSWHWTFGDGSSSAARHPVHKYNSPGTYRVSLTVQGSSGSADYAATSVITVQAPPVKPAVTWFAINNGAASTPSRTVTLNSTCTGSPTEYMASEYANFSGASWKVYSTSASHVLSSGNGTKTVYFKVRSKSGDSSVSSDTITLNVTPPGQTVTVRVLPTNILMFDLSGCLPAWFSPSSIGSANFADPLGNTFGELVFDCPFKGMSYPLPGPWSGSPFASASGTAEWSLYLFNYNADNYYARIAGGIISVNAQFYQSDSRIENDMISTNTWVTAELTFIPTTHIVYVPEWNLRFDLTGLQFTALQAVSDGSPHSYPLSQVGAMRAYPADFFQTSGQEGILTFLASASK